MPLLHWLTRDDDIHAATHTPYRLLQEMKEFSYGDRDTANMLIQGDNLDALKALLPYYAGKVKCVFIDPPYNTKSAFEHYDDNLEHTKWLAMMYPRLEMLRELLAEDGSIWITIDDNEAHYLKVIMDEIFGRANFVNSVVWRSTDNSNNDAKQFSVDHNWIHVFSKKDDWLTIKDSEALTKRTHFKNPDNDPRGAYFDGNPLNSPAPRPNLTFDLVSPSGKVIKPPKNGWRWSKETIQEKIQSGEIRFTADEKNIRRRTYLADMKALPPSTLWAELEETGHNRQAKYELKKLALSDQIFGTPKPERLMHRILQIATNTGDLVLDSFLGSGTTAAVAHKMGRRYIGIEMGEHAKTHCVPRLQKVIEGEQGGISGAVAWEGGGGFRFYKLGVPVFDETGHVSEGIKFAPLAAHLWFLETGIPFSGRAKTPFLGSHEGIGYYLLYNGILGDKSVSGGNVLTAKILSNLPPHDGAKVIFGEGCRLSAERLIREGITFRQIPYEIKAR